MKLSAELKLQLEALKASAKNLTVTDEINAKIDEIKALKAKIALAEMEEEDERLEVENKIKNGEMKKLEGAGSADEDNNAEYTKAFYNVLRGRNVSQEEQAVIVEVNNALSSTTGEDGGLLIPVDQQTAIKELKREMLSLESLVNVEPVSTVTGSRNIEKDAESTPFTEFTEVDDIADAGSPQFTNVTYAIKDRGGILPIPNNLLADNTANLKAYLNKWLAKKSIATRNKLITDKLATLTKSAIASIDDVKKIINVTLDPAISAMAIVVTNQDGFNKFDTMKDSDGKYLLQPNPLNPTQKLLAGKPVFVYSNKTLKTVATKAPVIIGSLKEAITLFDREQTSLVSTNVGGDAFKKNRTDIRAISREDVQLVDGSAATIVYGEIVVE